MPSMKRPSTHSLILSLFVGVGSQNASADNCDCEIRRQRRQCWDSRHENRTQVHRRPARYPDFECLKQQRLTKSDAEIDQLLEKSEGDSSRHGAEDG